MTGKQFGLAFVLICAYLVALAVPLGLAILVLRAVGASDGVAVIVLLAIVLIGVAALIPYMNEVMKRVVTFPGQGAPVPLAELQQRLEALAHAEMPFVLERTDWGYIATLRYADARWRELFGKGGLSSVFEMHIKLDPAGHIATLTDFDRSAAWGVGANGVRLGMRRSRGVQSSWSREIIISPFGVESGGQTSTSYSYSFSSNAFKRPLMDVLRESGWTARYALF